MATKESVLLNIKKDIHLEIIGTYFEAEEGVNLPERFEIDEISSVYKDILPLMEFCNNVPKDELLRYLEEEVLEKIER